jgi:pSer/pThr/pTyr-binding forkhead associated (FHA) protein
VATKPTPEASGGRVVCLTDGREYAVGSEPLVFGRDATSDVVVTGGEVSRKHAEIQMGAEGYVLLDLSANGTFVNGKRVVHDHSLARADVIRIGTDEFRFYAEAAPAAPPLARRPVPSEGPLDTPTGASARLADTMHGVPSFTPSDPRPTPPSAPLPPPIASLLVRSGEMRGRRLPIIIPVVNVGRADYNDIVLADPSVSTTHAKLQRRDDVWVLTDLGSTNGTYVEGEPVTGETALTPGTTLRFGDVAALFEPHDEPKPAGSPAEEPRVEPLPAPASDEPGAEPRPAARRPIRAAAPKPSGPPTWLIALIVIAAIVIAYVLLTSS